MANGKRVFRKTGWVFTDDRYEYYVGAPNAEKAKEYLAKKYSSPPEGDPVEVDASKWSVLNVANGEVHPVQRIKIDMTPNTKKD